MKYHTVVMKYNTVEKRMEKMPSGRMLEVPKMTAVHAMTDHKYTEEEMLFALTGKSLQAFLLDLLINPDGKYDKIFKPRSHKQGEEGEAVSEEGLA